MPVCFYTWQPYDPRHKVQPVNRGRRRGVTQSPARKKRRKR